MQRAGGHQKGTSKEGHAASRCFVLGWCRMGAAARRAWGVSVVQTRGGLVPWWKRRGGLWGALSLSEGGAASYGLPPLLCLGVDPPWCSTDPASPTAALQKGLCWGVCRLYPGLRGCVRRRKRRREGLNPAACCENAWSGVKALEKKRGMGRGGYCCSGGGAPPFPRPARLGVGCKRRGGCPRGSDRKKGVVVVLPSSLFSCSLSGRPRRAPLPECYGRMDARMEGVCERNWYVRRLRGVL